MQDKSRPDKIELIFSVGEASGDRLASSLYKSMIASATDGTQVCASGICGESMKTAGINPIVDCTNWGSMGVVEALRLYTKYKAGMRAIQRHLLAKRGQNIALVLVDFGYFNVNLAKWANKNGIGPILYFMPPGSWKRKQRPSRMSKFVQLSGLIVTPFHWSDEQLRAAGGNSYWPGHPLLDIVRPNATYAQFDEKYQIEASARVISLLPGSRTAEIKNILPVMLNAAKQVADKAPNTHFVIGASSEPNRKLIDDLVRRSGAGLRVSIADNATYDCLARSEFAIITSGTATLEAAIIGTPMVIVYGGAWIVEQEYKLRKRSLNLQFFGLPNIIANEKIIPEVIFIDGQGADEVAEIACAHLADLSLATAMKNQLRDRVVSTLGEPGVIDRAAKKTWKFLTVN